MGQTYEFRCPSCGYRAEVSGGDDAGMVACTTTIICEDCRKLFDITTDLLDSSTEDKQPEFRCPKQASHRVHKWSANGPCPRCGTRMEKGKLTILWD